MKNKKMIWSVCVCIVLIVCGLSFFLFKEKSSLNKGQIRNIKETTISDLPSFRTVVLGDYTGLFINTDVEKIKAYEFDATVDNGWSIEKDHYVGIRVRDAFEYLSIDNYSQVIFQSSGLVSVIYRRTDITDDTFFVIKKNGELISEDVLNLISFDKNYNYNVEDLFSINVTKEEA